MTTVRAGVIAGVDTHADTTDIPNRNVVTLAVYMDCFERVINHLVCFIHGAIAVIVDAISGASREKGSNGQQQRRGWWCRA